MEVIGLDAHWWRVCHQGRRKLCSRPYGPCCNAIFCVSPSSTVHAGKRSKAVEQASEALCYCLLWQVTGLSNSEEESTGRAALVPFLLEDKLKEVGFQRSINWLLTLRMRTL